MGNDRKALEELIGYLVVNLTNLKKSPNRLYLPQTLKKKVTYCRETHDKAKELLAKLIFHLEAEEFENYKRKLNNTYSQFEKLIEEKLREMTTTEKLDIGLALKLVRPFDGTTSNLQLYIESVNLLKDYSTNVPEAELIKFMKVSLTVLSHFRKHP